MPDCLILSLNLALSALIHVQLRDLPLIKSIDFNDLLLKEDSKKPISH